MRLNEFEKVPKIIIVELGYKKYEWRYCLTSNLNKPSCRSPRHYESAARAKTRAKEFFRKNFNCHIMIIDKPQNKVEHINKERANDAA